MNNRRKFLGLSALLPFCLVKTGNNEIQLGDHIRGKETGETGQVMMMETAKYFCKFHSTEIWDEQYPKWKNYPVYWVQRDGEVIKTCGVCNHFQIEKI